MDSVETPTRRLSLPTKAAFLAYGTAAFIDTSVTSFCHGAQTCNERNPLLRPIVDNHGVVAAMAVKGAMHTVVALWLSSQHEKHPKAVLWTTIALAVAQGTVDAYNIKQLRR
mgnify:CR=1 FL=1